MKTLLGHKKAGGGHHLTADRWSLISGRRPLTSGVRAGFSLLELLLAITVLIIIVLVIALVFQQANTAWRSGTRKAGAETTLRSIMGVIEHDLTEAVDGTQFGVSTPNGFDQYSATLVTLDGTNRMPQQVKYSYSGGDLTRATFAMSAGTSPTNWAVGVQTSTAILNGSQPLSSFSFNPVWGAGMPSPALPLCVEIEAHVQKKGTFAVVSGYSLGQNQKPSDRIVASP
jgi:Tfp pilus assembly protein PilE